MTKKFTAEEEAALRDCITRELSKFTTDEKIMPERIKLLTNVLSKLS